MTAGKGPEVELREEVGFVMGPGVLPNDIYTAITVIRAKPPLESSAPLVLRRGMIL